MDKELPTVEDVIENNPTLSAHRRDHLRLLTIVPRLDRDYSDHGGTVERWADDTRDDPDCSSGCKWARWLDGPLGSDWCVCTNPRGYRKGLLTFEHQTGWCCYEPEEGKSGPE